METKKKFDCLEMKYNIQQQINAETKNMSSQELLLYFNANSSGEKETKKTDSCSKRIKLNPKDNPGCSQ